MIYICKTRANRLEHTCVYIFTVYVSWYTACIAHDALMKRKRYRLFLASSVVYLREDAKHIHVIHVQIRQRNIQWGISSRDSPTTLIYCIYNARVHKGKP